MTPARGVVFDFDGVLADTEHAHLAAFQDAFAARGWTLTRKAYFDRYLGFDDHDLVRAFTSDLGLAVDSRNTAALLRDKARRYEQRLANGAVLFPEAADAIARMASRFRIGIASGSLRAEILDILDANGLTGVFTVIVGADDVLLSKPAPDPYLLAVDRLGVHPSNAVAIEDSQWGLASARAAGLWTIGITTSYPAHALSGAHAVVDSLDQVTVEFVERLLGVR